MLDRTADSQPQLNTEALESNQTHLPVLQEMLTVRDSAAKSLAYTELTIGRRHRSRR
eukprot:COSAG01_NODE_12611_length_1684_cov_1.874690_2_plen_56_part_01